MRILTVGNMYPPEHLGGYELMWRSSVAFLRDRGHRVRVLTTDYRTERRDPAIAEDPDAHRQLRWYWRDHRWPQISPRERIRIERHNLTTLERHLDDYRPDAIAWWSMGGMSLGLVERALDRAVPGAGVVVDEWLLYAPKVDGWQRLARRGGALGRALGSALGLPTGISFDARLEWVVASTTLLNHAHAAGWTLPRRRIAHPGVDQELFAPAPRRPWRGRLLYVGRLDPRKGAHTAIEALTRLPEATLTILGAGEPTYERDLRGLAAKLGLEARVSFSSLPRDRLAGAYACADALVFPVSWSEPFGLVPLEAMAVGCPVIATGTGGSGEYLRDRSNCLLYGPASDSGGLARAVEQLAGDEALRERLAEGGRETAAGFDEGAFNCAVEAALIRTIG